MKLRIMEKVVISLGGSVVSSNAINMGFIKAFVTALEAISSRLYIIINFLSNAYR